MKTTDSVKDKFIKWLAEESGEPEHLVMLMQSVYVNPESMFKFYSHSLAEARREWVEEIRGKVNDMKYRGIDHSDFEARRHNALLEKIEDLLTGDNPEEAK